MMSPARRSIEILRRLRLTVGLPGLLIGLFAILAFGFGLYVLISEYNWPRTAAHDALHLLIHGATRAPDSEGLTLVDYVESWQRAPEFMKPTAQALIVAALRDIGDELTRQNERFPLFQIVAMEVRPRGRPAVAAWEAKSLPQSGPGVATETFELTGGGAGPSMDLVLRCQIAPSVGRAALGLETSYHRLLLAVLGLSAYSLLCLAYMIFQARSLSERVSREAAQEAVIDLADRTCHELGNGVFVLSNERKNLTGHLDLIDRFVTEAGPARAAAADRAGVDPELAARLEQALKREFAARGIDPELEIRGSATMARDACRQIAVCSEYFALTVRELDGFLKRTPLAVTLEPLSVAAVLDEALALLGPRLEAADAHVVRDQLADRRLWVHADRRLLVHALVNLIKNALEAAGEDGKRAEITLSASDEETLVWLSVADYGPGIAEADLSRVFDEDFSTKGPGRGRGLAIVSESIKVQHGEIRVTRRPGGGTCFQLGLPKAKPEESGARESS
jgi:signal transduction histidine kinase